MKKYEYYPIKIYLKDKDRRTRFKEIIAHFGTGDKAIERIIAVYDVGGLEVKFA